MTSLDTWSKIVTLIYTLAQIYPHSKWNSKLSTKLRLKFQVEYRFKLEYVKERIHVQQSYQSKKGTYHVFYMATPNQSIESVGET